MRTRRHQLAPPAQQTEPSRPEDSTDHLCLLLVAPPREADGLPRRLLVLAGSIQPSGRRAVVAEVGILEPPSLASPDERAAVPRTVVLELDALSDGPDEQGVSVAGVARRQLRSRSRGQTRGICVLAGQPTQSLDDFVLELLHVVVAPTYRLFGRPAEQGRFWSHGSPPLSPAPRTGFTQHRARRPPPVTPASNEVPTRRSGVAEPQRGSSIQRASVGGGTGQTHTSPPPSPPASPAASVARLRTRYICRARPPQKYSSQSV
jgi:hypothetical protein